MCIRDRYYTSYIIHLYEYDRPIAVAAVCVRFIKMLLFGTNYKILWRTVLRIFSSHEARHQYLSNEVYKGKDSFAVFVILGILLLTLTTIYKKYWSIVIMYCFCDQHDFYRSDGYQRNMPIYSHKSEVIRCCQCYITGPWAYNTYRQLFQKCYEMFGQHRDWVY